jgi:Cof subfamily protein (haloacid dehalogenase superfamily)
MGIFTGVLLASDFDNTLIYTEEAMRLGAPPPALSARNRAALEDFMAQGGRFAIATGRALPSFRQYAHLVPMNAPGIVCNGAALYDFQACAYLETALLDDDLVRRRGQAVLDRFPSVAVEAYHIDNVIHAVHPNAVTRQHEHLTRVTVTETASLAEVPLPLGKLLFEAERETLEQVRDFLTEQGWSADYELIFSGKTLLELTARGANKGGMLRRLAAYLHIPMDHVYCAGDEANDLSMLTLAAQGFAPANCAPAVRESGVTLVSDARADALADVIDQLRQRYG